MDPNDSEFLDLVSRMIAAVDDLQIARNNTDQPVLEEDAFEVLMQVRNDISEGYYE